MISPTSNKTYTYQPQTHKPQRSDFSTLLANQIATPSGTQIARPSDMEFTKEDGFDDIKWGTLIKAETNYAEPIKCKAPDPTYPDSISKLSLSELKAALYGAGAACDYLDTKGMTQAEIYNAFESIYKDYLGKDFMEPALTQSQNGGIDCLAFEQFRSVLVSKGVFANKELLLEARGYTGMSESEIRAAVRGEYPDQMTLRQTLAMAFELCRLGFDEGYGSNLKMTIISMLGGSDPTSEKVFGAMLDLPADYDTIKASYDVFVKNDRIIDTAYDMNATIKKLIAWVGGSPTAYDKILAMLKDMDQDKK